MLTCRQAALLMSKELDRELPAWNRVLLRVHLVVCHSCRTVRRQLALLKREAMNQAPIDSLPDNSVEEPQLAIEQKNRLKKALRDEQDPSNL